MTVRYPNLGQIFDLSGYVTEYWVSLPTGAWTFEAQVEPNTVKLRMRTRSGTNPVLVPSGVLPEELLPTGNQSIGAISNVGSLRLFFSTAGELRFFAADYGLADGRINDLSFQHEYKRPA